MIFATSTTIKSFVLAGCATSALILSGAASAQAVEQHEFQIAPQDLGDALAEFSVQGDAEVYWLKEDVAGKKTDGVSGSYTNRQAIEKLLNDAGVEYRIDDNGTLLVGDAYVQRASLGEGVSPTPFRVAPADQGETIREIGRRDPDDETVQDTIIVTGTNIRGADPVAPVLSFDREAIDRGGFATTEELIRTLPQNFEGGASRDVNPVVGGAFANQSYGTGVNLRGLGTNATLVLLNGRRLATTAGGDVIDVSLIPLPAIDRVEVLASGASAVYGSDAIAGVVNFFTLRDFDGHQTNFRYGAVTDGGYNETQVSHVSGFNWGTGNLTASYLFRTNSELDSSDRGFSDAAADPLWLIPEQETHSGFLSFTQDLSDNIAFGVDAIYSRRDFDARSQLPPFPGLALVTGDTELFSVAGGVNWELPNHWLFKLDASFSEQNEETTQNYPDIPIVFVDPRSSRVWSVDPTISGPAFSMPAGDVQVAAGLSFRKENYEDDDPTNLEREVFAVFGEALIPVVRDAGPVELFQVSVAGRYDDYSDFGSAFNPRVGASVELPRGVKFRGSYSESFRAPNLCLLSEPALAIGYIEFVSDPQAAGGQSVALIVDGHNENLEAEESENFSFGMEWRPEKGFIESISVDYFNYEFSGRIERVFARTFSNFLPQEQALGDLVTRDPALSDVNFFLDQTYRTILDDIGISDPSDIDILADLRYQNTATTEFSGLDVNLTGSEDFDWGSFGFNANLSFILDSEIQFTPDAPLAPNSGVIGRPAEFRSTVSAFATWDGLTGNIRLNYTDGYEDNVDALCVSNGCDVDSWMTLDLTLAYEISDNVNLLNGTRIGLEISNLFDEDPPFAPRFDSVNYDSANADPFGRIIRANLTKNW